MSTYVNYDSIPSLPTHLDFNPVKEQQMRNGKPVDGQFWVVNPLTDQVMGLAKKQHTPVNFTKMWDNFRAGVDASGIDTSQLQVKFNTAKNGSAFRADIIFKNYDYKKVVGEATQMKMRILDSHDQTLRRDVSAMLMRLACTNGMVTMGERLKFIQKHTRMSDPERVGAIVSEFPIRLESEAELYKVLQGKQVTTDQARDFFTQEVATYMTATGPKVNKKSVEECMRLWYQYDMGQNGYRLYNVLTHLGTHVTGREDSDITRKQIRIEQNVEKIVQAPQFQRLVGLAA